MELSLKPGKYIVAVSGGVDSVALLHALTQAKGLQLVIAHFDHGIRPDSAEDAIFVKNLARKYQLSYIVERVELGADASEADAREARYVFLNRALEQHDAQAIITAHHQDDVLETALINLLRGTGRRGLSSLKSNETLQRPLLHVSKKDITAYAVKHNLSWREDSTNYDDRYTRNLIRHRLLGNCPDSARQQLLQIVSDAAHTNEALDNELVQALQHHAKVNEIDTVWLKTLPHMVACEVMASWLRANNIADFDRPTIERLVVQAKTKPVGKRLAVRRNRHITVGNKALALEPAER